MYVNGTQPPLPLKTAAEIDQKIKQLCDAVAQGQVAPSAPCNAVFCMPGEQDEKRLDDALNAIFRGE